MSPGIGRVILRDDFSDDSVWDTATSDNGSAAISRNRLTLAVQPGYYLSSMRREVPLSDFYAEITARPSLCRGEDNYGLIVRGIGNYFYRFVLTCNRTGPRGTRSTAGPSCPSMNRSPAEMLRARRAKSASESGQSAAKCDFSSMDVINSVYRINPSPAAALGVFVRSAGDTPTTVTFSDLKVYDVDYISATTPTRCSDASLPGTLTIDD